MNESHLKDLIDNEFKRVRIQNHQDYLEWYASLSTYAKLIVESILEEDVSSEMTSFAQDSPRDELDNYEFMRVIAEMDPIPSNLLGLTNVTLEYILYDLSEFSRMVTGADNWNPLPCGLVSHCCDTTLGTCWYRKIVVQFGEAAQRI